VEPRCAMIAIYDAVTWCGGVATDDSWALRTPATSNFSR
jgi:hypothetical protein